MKRGKIIYYSVLILLIMLVTSLYISYAFLTSKNEENGKLNIVAGTLDYKIESEDLENNEITVEAGQTKEILIKLTSLNSIDSKYELYYKTDNNDIIVGYGEDTSSTGTINSNGTETISVIIQNKSNNAQTITFGVKLGLINNDLVLADTETSLIDYCSDEHVYTFDYTGNSQEFITLCSGNYKIELWGASGSDLVKNSDSRYDVVDPGLGAYTAGNIAMSRDESLYLYVGSTRSYNAGILSGEAPGGGATDVRITGGEWYTFSSLKDRIMVAAGGGGFTSNNTSNRNSGHGGGLVGYNANAYYAGFSDMLDNYRGHGGTQNSVGASGNINLTHESFKNLNYHIVEGGFGLASYGIDDNGYTYSSSGGGGYYGGGHGVHPGAAWTGGGGGSSFISGHNGCNAINEESTENNIIHTEQSIHYSGMYFTNTTMIDGRGYKWTTEKGTEVVGMPNHNNTATMTGNSGNGYAKITYLGE